MNLSNSRPSVPPATRRAVILTSYLKQSPRSNRLGAPGYSYDIVAQLFTPLLERWGEVVPVPCDPRRIETAIAAARQRGLQPIQVSFLPFQDVYLTPSAPNVVFPFWEYPDVPAEAFDGNPQNNWVATANRCDLLLVCGRFTAEAFERAGIRTPIRIVPVPTPDEYFHIPRWSSKQSVRIACPAYVFPNADVPSHELWDAPDAEQHEDQPPARHSLKRVLMGKLRRSYRYLMKPLVPPIVHETMRNRLRPLKNDAWRAYLASCQRQELELSGIVFTSIFSPHDGRKNWPDLLSAFMVALRDRPDATLVVKLLSRDRLKIEDVLHYYRTLGMGHRCKTVFITEYLSDRQMIELAKASTYYLTTTQAEGCCLPLLNYLAAGRPGIAPCHSAISDYFDPEMGLVLRSCTERAIWPQDRRVRFKTTWQRLEWPSIVEQVRAGYELARTDAAGYEKLADAAQTRMKEWVHSETVWPRLRETLDQLVTKTSEQLAA